MSRRGSISKFAIQTYESRCVLRESHILLVFERSKVSSVRSQIELRNGTKASHDHERIEMERFSLISSKPFQAVLAALKAAVGHPDMAEFAKATKGARLSVNWKMSFEEDSGRRSS